MILVLILTTYIGALLRANTETTTSENIVHIVYPKFRSLDIVCKKIFRHAEYESARRDLNSFFGKRA